MLKGEQNLEPLLCRYVTLRITNMRGVDNQLIPWERYQDGDLVWWSFVISPEGSLYSVLGGRNNGKGDEAILTAGALRAQLQGVLDHHYDPRRASWKIDRATNSDSNVKSLDTHPGWKGWLKTRGATDAGECIHCHECAEVIQIPHIEAGAIQESDFYTWPLPENIGLTLEPGTLTVKNVIKGSVAEKVGVKAGDVLGAAAGHRIFTETDLRAELQNIAADSRSFDLVWLRKGKVMSVTLELTAGWRKVDLSSRRSVQNAPIGANSGFPWGHAANANDRKARGIAKGMAVKPYKPNGSPAGKAGLKADDIIVAINGNNPDISGRELNIWFKFNIKEGEKITLTLVNPKGEKRDISYTAKLKYE